METYSFKKVGLLFLLVTAMLGCQQPGVGPKENPPSVRQPPASAPVVDESAPVLTTNAAGLSVDTNTIGTAAAFNGTYTLNFNEIIQELGTIPPVSSGTGITVSETNTGETVKTGAAIDYSVSGTGLTIAISGITSGSAGITSGDSISFDIPLDATNGIKDTSNNIYTGGDIAVVISYPADTTAPELASDASSLNTTAGGTDATAFNGTYTLSFNENIQMLGAIPAVTGGTGITVSETNAGEINKSGAGIIYSVSGTNLTIAISSIASGGIGITSGDSISFDIPLDAINGIGDTSNNIYTGSSITVVISYVP